MGIKGLTTYINNRSDIYLEDYQLCDTYLVIDGLNIAFQIYTCYAKCNCSFGGDYDVYADSVSKFFDDLLKCNVTPLVIFDGAYESTKQRTKMYRYKELIRTASTWGPTSQKRMKFFPLFLVLVFTNVLKEKNIRHVKCFFEADNDIAAVGYALNCPILSYDSDFYIYGGLYIPFKTLDNQLTKRCSGQGYMKRCKVYRVNNLLRHFKLDRVMLPLAAILLGNDYIKPGTFKKFFNQISMSRRLNKNYSHQQRLIEALFIWLSRYTLDKAIFAILNKLPKRRRERTLNIIKNNINSYTNMSLNILIPLGFSENYILNIKAHHENENLSCPVNINRLTCTDVLYKEDSSDSAEETDQSDMASVFGDSDFMLSCKSVDALPIWFIHEFQNAVYSSFFMDMLTNQKIYLYMQIENFSYPSSNLICLKIISVLFGLLQSAMNNGTHILKYVTRGEGVNIICNELSPTEAISGHKLPTLHNLRNLSLADRKGIIDSTLGIDAMDNIQELPPEWMLYVASIKYWLKHENQNLLKGYHLYALLFSMLFHIIDLKIGKCRTMQRFHSKYSKLIQSIDTKRKGNKSNRCTTDTTIIEAYNKIEYDDCLLAAEFFISHFTMNEELYQNTKKYNKNTVHVFASFQACLSHSVDLNTLLNYPYKPINIANLYNGTLLYNLSTNFRKRCNIEDYISTVLRISPSLLRLFDVFLSKIRPMFTLLYE